MTLAQSDARHRLSAASVYRHHELLRPTAAFIHIFYSQLRLDLCCWVAKGLAKQMQASRSGAACLFIVAASE